jgi:hypothetical protein
MSFLSHRMRAYNLKLAFAEATVKIIGGQPH